GLLKKCVNDQNRNCGGHRGSREPSPLHADFREVGVNADLNDSRGFGLNQAVTEQKLVPNISEDQNSSGQEPGAHQWERDPIKDPGTGIAVNSSGLFQLDWNGIDEAAQQPNQ